MTAEISKKLFLDADYNLVEKVNSENMRMLSQEEKNKLVMLSKRPMKQLKQELEDSVNGFRRRTSTEREKEALESSKENLVHNPKFNVELPNNNNSDLKTEPTSNQISTKMKVYKPRKIVNSLPPELNSALEAGLISPTELARVMAGEVLEKQDVNIGKINNPTSDLNEILENGATKIGQKKVPTTNIEEMLEDPINIKEKDIVKGSEEFEDPINIKDEDLVTGWLGNELLPSGWKLKIACDGKPCDEPVRNYFLSSFSLFFSP